MIMYEIDFKKPVHVYFIGIGGISMSGLAEILLDSGFTVSGSDSKQSQLTDELTLKGAKITYGHFASSIHSGIELVIYTAAIKADNPELMAATQLQLPILSRAELLGQIMKKYELPIAVSGTHGKTSTTSMISEILLKADTDPTLSIGGILKSIHGNFRIGKSEYFVTEACEYTNSFLSFFPKIALILNIEEDHMDFFHDIYEIRESFKNFARLLPPDGTLIINHDIPDYEQIIAGLPCRIITFGKSFDADYSFNNVTYDHSGKASFTVLRKDGSSFELNLSVPGEHNILNALAAVALAESLNIAAPVTVDALNQFTGSNRRFEFKGKIGGITVIDDYAHHPTEIRATLQAAANYTHETLWCVFQPHTYTRTNAFLKEFADALSMADKVILADIYAAREINTLGITSKDLQKLLLESGKECYYFPTFDEIENFLLEHCINGDLLITMGAGDIVKVGESILGL